MVSKPRGLSLEAFLRLFFFPIFIMVTTIFKIPSRNLGLNVPMQFHMESRWYVHKVLSLSHGESDDILLENLSPLLFLKVTLEAFFIHCVRH